VTSFLIHCQRLVCLLFFFSCHRPHRDLHSFPTRRSSDLNTIHARIDILCSPCRLPLVLLRRRHCSKFGGPRGPHIRRQPLGPPRSEEHTSELQSRGHLVCRLLLEKKTNILHNLFQTNTLT